MDVGFWAARVHSSKHLPFALSSGHTSNHPDGDDDARVCIACPLCDVDIEVVVLHSHLQEDHGFEFKNAVCPLCAANLETDVIGHFTTNHFMRKSEKTGLWTTTSAMFGRELSSFLGSSKNGKGNSHESAPDPLLSPFLSSLSNPELKEKMQSESSGNSSSLPNPSKSAEPSSPNRNNEVDCKERRRRAVFVQQLVVSSII